MSFSFTAGATCCQKWSSPSKWNHIGICKSWRAISRLAEVADRTAASLWTLKTFISNSAIASPLRLCERWILEISILLKILLTSINDMVRIVWKVISKILWWNICKKIILQFHYLYSRIRMRLQHLISRAARSTLKLQAQLLPWRTATAYNVYSARHAVCVFCTPSVNENVRISQA